jgi:hypothetical protein
MVSTNESCCFFRKTCARLETTDARRRGCGRFGADDPCARRPDAIFLFTPRAFAS